MKTLNTFTIGRSADNQIVINKQGISRKHAQVRFITNNVLLLEDLNSTNGTFVDGRRIARTIIDYDSQVMLGQGERLNLKDILALHISAPTAQPQPGPTVNARPRLTISANAQKAEKADKLDFRAEFRQLEKVQEAYMIAREAVQTKDPVRQAWIRATLGVLFSGIGFAFGGSIMSSVGFAFGSIVAAHFINTNEKLIALEKEFKRVYVCPNPSCRQFLGNVPYSELLLRKRCRACNAQWAS